MSTGGTSRAAQDVELWARLAEAIPPLVHRLNNSLLVLSGALEFGTPETVRAAHDEIERVRKVLQDLALLSKPFELAAPAGELFDLEAPLETVATLLEPLAEARGVDLAIHPARRETLLRGSAATLRRALLLVALDALSTLGGARGSGPRPKLSLRGVRRPGRAAVYVTRTRLDAEDAGPRALLERLLDEPGMSKLSIQLRYARRALTSRFDLSARLVEGAQDASGGDGARRSAGAGERRGVQRLLLAHADDDERETIADFLTAEGYEVRTLARVRDWAQLAAGEPDLVLLDARLLRSLPRSRDALRDDPRLSDSVLLLGDGPPIRAESLDVGTTGSSSTHDPRALARNCRPGALLDAIRARLAAVRGA